MKNYVSLSVVLLLCASAALSAVVRPENLLLRASFDSTPVKDDSPYQRTLTQKGNPTIVPGKFGTAAKFNPGNAATDAYFAGQWQAGFQFSATAWFNFESLGGYPKILSQKNKFDDAGGWEFQYNNGIFSLVTGTDNAQAQSRTYVPNVWYHIAMTVRNNTVKFYLNGNDITGKGSAAVIKPFGGKDVTIGASANGQNVNDGGQWHGALDEVRVYDVVLSDEEVKAIYNEADSAIRGVADPNTPASPIAASCLAVNASGAPQSSLKFTYNDLFTANGVQFPGKSNEYMSFSYFASHVADGGQVRTRGTLTVSNVGTAPITINSIELKPATPDTPTYFSMSGLQNGAVIQPGQGATIVVNYDNYAGLQAKTVVRNFINIKSNDVARPDVTITLAGVYMTKKEGGDEIPVESIINALGFAVNPAIGYENFIIAEPDSKLTGDGLTFYQIQAVDTTKPVFFQMTATYAPCCGDRPGVSIPGCSLQVAAGWSQSIFPMSGNSDGLAAKACTAPTGNFWLAQDGQWFSNTPVTNGGFIAMRFFPLRDSDGTLIPNSYVVSQDYLHPVGCGTNPGQANCDYNDNTYVITNVRPVDSSAIDRSAVTDLPIKLTFDHSMTSGLSDSNGNFLGFTQFTLSNELDTNIRIHSYRPSLLRMDAENKALVMRTTDGDLQNNRMVNGLRFGLNIDQRSFGVSTTVKNADTLPAAVSAGAFLGSDQDNFVVLVVNGGTIKAQAEVTSYYQLQRGGDLAIEPKVDVNVFDLGNVTLPQGYKDVELFIFAEPTTNSLTFGYDIGNGVVYFGNRFTLPERNPTTGLRSSGRILGWGAAAGIVAYGGDSEVSFADFGVQTCVASSLSNAPTDAVTQAPTSQADTSADGNNTDATSQQGGNTSNSPVNSGVVDTGLVPTLSPGDNGNGSGLSGVGILVPSIALLLAALLAM